MIRRYLDWRVRRAGPPVTFGVKAARYGALAVVAAVAIIAIPVALGWSAAGTEDRPAFCDEAPSAWSDLKRAGYAMRRTGEPGRAAAPLGQDACV